MRVRMLMLRTRVITAVILLAAFAAIFLLLNPAQFVVAVALVAGLAAWEWGRLSVPEKPWVAVVFALVVFSLVVLLHRFDEVPRVLLPLAVVAWCLAPWLMYRWHARSNPPPSALALGLIVLVPAFLSIATLRWSADGTGYFLWGMLLVVWSADIGAYFAGKRFGRRKLAPRISPGKTWEGVVGGMVCATLVGMLFVMVFPRSGLEPGISWIMVCMLTAAFSVVGDLTESLVKRLAGVKDSSALLPGHGGVLDRIDGILAAAPFFVVATVFLQLV